MNLLAMWRTRRERARAAAMLRAESELMLDVGAAFQRMSDEMFDKAERQPQGSAEHWRLSFEAHALACASMAWTSKAGGDDAAAQQHMDAAEWWVRKAVQYDMRAREMEVSHA